MLRAFKSIDLFPKLTADGRESTAVEPPGSGLLRTAAWLLVAYLSWTELWTFLTPKVKQSFDLDMSETALDAGYQKKVRVMLNITVHGIPCIDVSLDYQDVMGSRVVDVRSTVFKTRLNSDGTVVGEVQKNDPKAATKGGPSSPSLYKGAGNSSCGSCFGALPDGECCNTCNDVIYAYRVKRWALPRIEEIEQCKSDGTAKAMYQPPQIIHFDDYSSDAYLPTFSKVGSLSQKADPQLAAPLKLQNISLTPLKLTDISSIFANFSLSPLMRDGLDDFRSWPWCIHNNWVIHGNDYSQALLRDLSGHGAASGCRNNNCSATDKFDSEEKEKCAEVCQAVLGCAWWSFGEEDGKNRCWLRSAENHRERRYGFSSGPKDCHPKKTVDQADWNATPSRRLSSMDDDFDEYPGRPLPLALGGSPYLPMFSMGWDGPEARQRREQQGESCQLSGYFDTNKVPGNFHIGTHGSSGPSYLSFFDDDGPPSSRNMEHTINNLAFVDPNLGESLNETQPLNGFTSPKAFTFQYYLTITPTTVLRTDGTSRHGYQYKSASYVTNELIGPAVFFRIDIDPIRATYYTEERRWSRLFVNFCAAVGGCVAMSSMLQRLLESMLCT
mmetsp:Transcript_11229/g.20499  ORF Transcript_11229/g.20499 Transcript_11229/m.20499 type:complete len:611 (-) Transcript_11229:71-1903(-)